MKHETPKLTALPPAINAIQGFKSIQSSVKSPGQDYDFIAAYEDWE